MKVKVSRRILVHEVSDKGKLGKEYETAPGGIYDLQNEEAYYLIGKGLASDLGKMSKSGK